MHVRVLVQGSQAALDLPADKDLLEVIQAAGLPILTACGGVASCGLCRVTIHQGKEHLNTISDAELHHLGSVAKIVGLRLSCQTRCIGPGEVHIEIPDAGDQGAKKRAKLARIKEERFLRTQPGTPILTGKKNQ